MSTNGNDVYLLQAARQAGITDLRELANFMGQIQVESGGFRSMTESTRYSATRLLEVFGPYTDRHGRWHDGRNGLTTLAEAQAITSRGPEGIAEAVYGGPWGARNLGNTEAGDGWKFRGRGYVQLTGRDHYEEVGRKLGIDLVGHPERAAEREIAAKIAILYWNERVRANGHQTDVPAATRDINGGQNALRHRIDAADEWNRRFREGYLDRLAPIAQGASALPPHTPVSHGRPGAMADGALTTGESGPQVRALQQHLDRLDYRDEQGSLLPANGRFDAATLYAVRRFQHDHGLNDQGYFGPLTQKALQDATARLVTSAGHPHHALYEQALEKVREAERARGTTPGPHSERIAAALTTELLRENITRVDRVEFNATNTLVRAVQVNPMRDEPGLNRTTDAISAPQASRQSVAESSREMHAVAVKLQARRQDPQFTPARPQPAPAH
ncbi:XVIPCD domain-containing protein [Lysobacter xanthus]